MNGYEYIISKQVNWALNQEITLVKFKGDKGRATYTQNLKENLFEPLLDEVYTNINNGGGGELKENEFDLSKMQAVHSSSALGVNIFQYWQSINKASEIAAACGFCREGNKISEKIVFEDKYPIGTKLGTPNIDVVIHNSDSANYKVFAIECKFSEAYGSRGHSGIDPKYLNQNDLWVDMPGLRSLAESIEKNDTIFEHLHPAQLIKHILGLNTNVGKDKFRLLYLWYDCPGEEGTLHRQEIQKFAAYTKMDKIKFHSMSYQELIIKLAKDYRESNKDYISYITNRYL